MKKLPALLMIIGIALICSSWGFFAHKRISRLAIFTLPPGMIGFYKSNINFITEHAVDPDKRRYTDTAEAPRHYLDADFYGASPFDSLPQKWDEAEKKYSLKVIQQYGIVPWQIQRTYYQLVNAFSERDSSRILHLSADLSHYIADAHVPLHTTQNHNGQLTGQSGIHAFWESRLPELFGDKYDYFTGKAKYVGDPGRQAWKILRHTFSLKDSVLLIEARINLLFRADKKFTFAEKNGKIERQYSEAYSEAYHIALKGMVEEQMRGAIAEVGNFWYSAWIDAGKPNLKKLRNKEVTNEEKKDTQKEEELYKDHKLIGREL